MLCICLLDSTFLPGLATNVNDKHESEVCTTTHVRSRGLSRTGCVVNRLRIRRIQKAQPSELFVQKFDINLCMKQLLRQTI